MYIHRQVGNTPKVDLSVARLQLAGTPVQTFHYDPLDVYLDPGALGSTFEAFSSVQLNASFSLSENKRASAGVALCTLNDVLKDMKERIYVEYSCKVLAYGAVVDPNHTKTMFIGFLDGVSPISGWGNFVTNYVMIPSDIQAFELSVCNQVLLESIRGNDMPMDKNVIVGFFLGHIVGGASSLNFVDYNISAKYADRTLTTVDKSR